MLSKRPIIQIQKSGVDKALELLTLVCIVAGWTFIALSYHQLPNIIPVHYNLRGEVDNYGAKETIWIFPVVVTLVIAGIYSLNKYPHYFNYMVDIHEKNAESQYTAATRLIRLFQFMVALVFLVIILDLIISAKGYKSFLGAWFVPVILIMFTVPVVFTIFKSKVKSPNQGS